MQQWPLYDPHGILTMADVIKARFIIAICRRIAFDGSFALT